MTHGTAYIDACTDIDVLREDLKLAQSRLEGTRKEIGKLEEAVGMVEEVRSNLLSLKAIDHLAGHSPHVLGSNLLANRGDLIQNALARIDELEAKANILPF